LPPAERAARDAAFLAGKNPDEPSGGAAGKAEADADAVAKVNLKKQRGEPITPEEKKAADEGQARIDARANVKKEQHDAITPVINKDAASFIVDRIVAGDPRATSNMSRTKENMTLVENELGARHKAGLIDAGQLLAAESVVRADQSSLNNLTKMTDAADSFENTASRNFDQAMRLAPAAIPTDWGPWVNRWIENSETALGDKNVPAYVVALLTGANEYAKIMSGSTGAQGSTVDSRREASELISPYLAKGQITEVIRVLKQEMGNRKDSLRDQLGYIQERLGRPLSERKSITPPGDGSTQQQFIEGKIYTDAKGNKAKYVNGRWEPVQ
jgi:hypothetical protein